MTLMLIIRLRNYNDLVILIKAFEPINYLILIMINFFWASIIYQHFHIIYLINYYFFLNFILWLNIRNNYYLPITWQYSNHYLLRIHQTIVYLFHYLFFFYSINDLKNDNYYLEKIKWLLCLVIIFDDYDVW